MKAFITILSVFFLSLHIGFAADQKEVQPETAATPQPEHLHLIDFVFENGKAEKFNVQLQVLGKYPINTKLGTERFQHLVDALRQSGLKVDFNANPSEDTSLLLMKFTIPKEKKLKTSEVIFVLDHCNVRPADVCEAMSLDRVDPRILDMKLPVCVFGTFIPCPENKTMIFIPAYASTKSALNDGAGLGTAFKRNNLWQGEMIIPVIITE